MLDGWYCRSIANMQAEEQARNTRPNDEEYSSDTSQSEHEPEINYKAQYLSLKKKLKYLIYENECFQDALRSSQKKLLKVSRDRTFLLDRLLQYEKPDHSTTESEDTESSDDGDYGRVDQPKRRKIESSNVTGIHHATLTPPPSNKTQSTVKRKRNVAPKKPPNPIVQQQQPMSQHMKTASSMTMGGLTSIGDGHMTPEEVERHLQSRQTYLELLPERAPPTVPTEMFSNDPSLDSESNDILETSPNVADEWIE